MRSCRLRQEGRQPIIVADPHPVNKQKRRCGIDATAREERMKSRRDFLKTTGGLVLATGGTWLAGHAHGADAVLGPPELPEGTLSASLLEALPGKVPLIKKSWRPPNFEKPVSYFND